MPPLHTFYTVGNDYNFSKPEGCGYICWPTVAPSGTHFYTSDKIPGWKDTFLMTTLKSGVIFQIRLNVDGTGIIEEPRALFHSENRYRDLAFSPDGSTIYVITDSAGPVQSMDNKETGQVASLKNPGSLIEFKYEGDSSDSAK